VIWQIFIGHRSAWFPLLSARRFVEFDTSVICHVLMQCLGSFLLQDMLLNLHKFALEGQDMKFTMNMLLTCILYCDAGNSDDFTSFRLLGFRGIFSHSVL